MKLWIYLLLIRDPRTIRLSSINATFSVVSDPLSSSSPRFLRGHISVNFYDKCKQLNMFENLLWPEWGKSELVAAPFINHILEFGFNVSFFHRADTHILVPRALLHTLLSYISGTVLYITDLLHNTSISSLCFSRGASMTLRRLKFPDCTSKVWPVMSAKRCQCRDIIA